MARNQPPKLPSSPKSTRVRHVVIPEAGIDVKLKDPWLAAFLAWLLPGLGHLYQRRTAKGVLFMVCILGTFLFGLYLGDGHVVYASLPHQQPYRWQYWCQIGAGAPALPALVQRERIKRGSEPFASGLMAPPRDPDVVRDFRLQEEVSLESIDEAGNLVHHPTELAKWNHDRPSRFELGTVFTMVAGLLNVLVIYDAFAGPLVILPDPKKKKKGKGENEEKEPRMDTNTHE
jgi:hypothetical protein